MILTYHLQVIQFIYLRLGLGLRYDHWAFFIGFNDRGRQIGKFFDFVRPKLQVILSKVLTYLRQVITV